MRTALLVLPLLVGCRSLPGEPENRYELSRAWGIATADLESDAEMLVSVVEAARPVYAGIAGFVDRPLRIHVAPGPLPWSSAGLTLRTRDGDAWILIEADGRYPRLAAAHELAHFYFADVLQLFPPLVAEGFCELLATRVEPDDVFLRWRVGSAGVSYLDEFTVKVHGPDSKRRLAYLVQDVPPLETALALPARALLEEQARARDAFYGIGLVIASCVGLDGFGDLVRRAREEGQERIPAPWILAAAGLDPLTQESLSAALARTVGADPGGKRATLELTLSDDELPAFTR